MIPGARSRDAGRIGIPGARNRRARRTGARTRPDPRSAVGGHVGIACVLLLTLAGGGPSEASPGWSPQDRPTLGQEGKDVEWIPTPDALVETMLEMAQVTPEDFVIDLGSGDGRTVIEAARRGARSLGVEYDASLVALSQERAEAAGVGGRARFRHADLFDVDLTPATVVSLFLLPDLNLRLRPRLLQLAAGTRIVSNTWDMGDWAADETVVLEPCPGFCTALLWIVPARAGGDWTATDGTLTLSQTYQTVSGTLRRGGERFDVEEGRLTGADLTFRAGGARYRGRVVGDSIEGAVATAGDTVPWSARRAP